MQLNKVFFEVISPEIEIVFKYLCFEYSLLILYKEVNHANCTVVWFVSPKHLETNM